MYELLEILNISQSSLSQHIDKLEHAGIVEVEHQGRKVLCKIIKKATNNASRILIN